MKRLLPILLLAALLLPVASLNTGCKTWNQDRIENISYKTLGSVAEGVDAALKAYADAWKQGKVPSELDARVSVTHEKYRVSMALAIASARTNWNAPATGEVVAVATELVNLIKEVL